MTLAPAVTATPPARLAGPIGVVLRFALNLALCVASLVVPKQRRLVLAGAGLGRRFMGNPKYFYLHLLGEGCERRAPSQLRGVWITENRTLVEDFERRGWPVVDKLSWRGFWLLLRAEYWVSESGMRVRDVAHDLAFAWLPFGRFAIVNTWHGTAIKLIGLDALRARGERGLVARVFYWISRIEFARHRYVVGQSRHDVQVFESAFANRHVQLLGSPRNDVFHGHRSRVLDLRGRLGLDRYERVVLYAPTYREARATAAGAARFEQLTAPLCPFSDEFLARFDAELGERRWAFLVLKHHLDTALTIPAGLTNIVDIGAIGDIMELLVETDILVTDYSSVSFDFLCAKKPIVFYVYDEADYRATTKAYYLDYFAAMPGPFARTEQEFAELLFSADSWFPSAQYQARFQPFRGHFQPFEKGSACARLEALLEHRGARKNQSLLNGR